MRTILSLWRSALSFSDIFCGHILSTETEAILYIDTKKLIKNTPMYKIVYRSAVFERNRFSVSGVKIRRELQISCLFLVHNIKRKLQIGYNLEKSKKRPIRAKTVLFIA